MTKKKAYLYFCDHPGCDEYDMGAFGRVRSKRGSGVDKHWCLEHYPYDKCSHCAHAMRPSGGLRTNWPKTRAKGAGGLCGACYLHKRSHGKLPNREKLTTGRELRRITDEPHHEGEGDWQLPKE